MNAVTGRDTLRTMDDRPLLPCVDAIFREITPRSCVIDVTFQWLDNNGITRHSPCDQLFRTLPSVHSTPSLDDLFCQGN
ncbi:hypothetical protein EV363DRAFT_1394807 [Boletus edulis]|nr:hypothetical protein EV363DRAFT_1394807 [Boletus edulis]